MLCHPKCYIVEHHKVLPLTPSWVRCRQMQFWKYICEYEKYIARHKPPSGNFLSRTKPIKIWFSIFFGWRGVVDPLETSFWARLLLLSSLSGGVEQFPVPAETFPPFLKRNQNEDTTFPSTAAAAVGPSINDALGRYVFLRADDESLIWTIFRKLSH